MTGRCTERALNRRKGAWGAFYGAIARFFQGALLALFAHCLIPAAAAANPIRIVAFGDSLTAGYGLPADQAYPAVLEKRLLADGYEVQIVNAGVSGDTTEGGLARIDYALEDGADLVILELGANDMLNGVDPKITRKNLERIIAACHEKGAKIFLGGMVASGNFGQSHQREFDAIFPGLAAKHSLPFYPFFLEGVVNDPNLVLWGGLHPNAAGVERIVAGIAPPIEKTLDAMRRSREKEHVTK
jgi:acyl-CoA thioesterase-1